MHTARATGSLSRILIGVLVLLLAAHAFGAPVKHKRHRSLKTAPPIRAAIRTDGSVELVWRSYSDSLCIERRSTQDDLFSVVECFSKHQTSYVDSTPLPNATVYYRLRPAAARYITEFGDELSVTVVLPAPPPPKLKRIAVDSVEVTLDTPVNTYEGVLVERKVEGIYSTVGRIPRGEQSYRDGSMKVGIYQRYRLRYEGRRFVGPPSPIDSIPLDLTPPSATMLSYPNDHSVRLTWQPTAQFPCSYQIEKRSSAGIQSFRTDLGATEWTDGDLRYDQHTYYRVRATSGEDTSDFGIPVAAYYVLRPAIDLKADPMHDLVVHLAWSDADSLTSTFVVERSSDSLHYSELARLSARTYTYADSLPRRGLTFWYRITSIASSGRTAVSDAIMESIPVIEAGMVYVTDSLRNAAFYCDALEVTAAQYVEFCRVNERDFPEEPGFPGHPEYWDARNRLPAVNVSWNDAIAFCNWRSISVGLQPAYDAFGRIITTANGYRLPDRSDYQTLLKSGADTTANLLDSKGGAGEPIIPILMDTRRLAIYNIIGNVWEWTNDSIADGGRVIIGGAYSTPRNLSKDLPEFCYRTDYTSPTIGFRCILPASH